MILNLPTEIASQYKSPSQQARVLTEAWAVTNMYCPACSSDSLARTKDNTEAVDFVCPGCGAPFQLKASRSRFGRKITDAAYHATMRALLEDRLPHLLLLHYDLCDGVVHDLLLVPRFGLGPSAIEARKPLALSARRAGWVGCNIVLDSVPPEARIPVVSSGEVVAAASVRNRFRFAKRLGKVSPMRRGWTLDVLTALRTLGTRIFTLADAYSFEKLLAAKHPENRNVRPKIRQQLQVLRDLGYMDFVERGVYRWLRNV